MSYIHLTKPRSVLLLLVTALSGMVLSHPGFPPIQLVALTLLGGALAAGGANTLNCYLDRDLDRLMARTAARPLPSGRLRPGRALAYGLALCVLAITILALTVNLLSAVLAAAGIFYYVVIYTLWLKRSTVWNVVIGGGAGVMPILVGWAGGAGELSPWALWLGAVVFCWTPMHFWSLALFRRQEYAEAKVPMLPVVLGEGETRRQILLYSLLLIAVTLLPVSSGFTGISFLLAALLLGALLIYRVTQLQRSASPWAARRLYRYSMFYLAVLFGCLILDRAMGWSQLVGAS